MDGHTVKFERRFFIGVEYFGRLSGEGWSAENSIGRLWQRWSEFAGAHWEELEPHLRRSQASYEIHFWNEEESQATGHFGTFVGAELADLDFEIPPYLAVKVIPAGEFAFFTIEGEAITRWEPAVYEEWLPQSGYRQDTRFGYDFQLTRYEESRFKGLGDQIKESEIDVFIPVVADLEPAST